MDHKRFSAVTEKREKFMVHEIEELFFDKEYSTLELTETANAYFREKFKARINFFYPGRKFPAVSITNGSCQLNCSHCNKIYLSQMIPISRYKSLLDFAKSAEDKGALGALVSGGCDRDGAVPLEDFLEDIYRVKRETSLILNVHTGLLRPRIIKRLADTNIDIVSYDLPGDDEVIRNVFHLSKSWVDYREGFRKLMSAGINYVVPHICLGLNKGEIKGEFNALRVLEEFDPELIVIIIFTPTKGTEFQYLSPPPLNSVTRILSLIRIAFPSAQLSLGCMKPRGRLKTDIELAAIQSGVNRIVIPSLETMKFVSRTNFPVKKYYGCCCLPDKLLPVFEII